MSSIQKNMNEESRSKLLKSTKSYTSFVHDLSQNSTNQASNSNVSSNLILANTLNQSNNLSSIYSNATANLNTALNTNSNNNNNGHNFVNQMYHSTNRSLHPELYSNIHSLQQQQQQQQKQQNQPTQPISLTNSTSSSDIQFSSFNNQLSNSFVSQNYTNDSSQSFNMNSRKNNLLMDRQFYQCVESLHKSISDLIHNQSKTKDFIPCHNNSCSSDSCGGMSLNSFGAPFQTKANINDNANDAVYFQEGQHESNIQMEEEKSLKEFAEFFKSRRMKLGATQSDVGNALANLNIQGVESLSQSTICRFESLTLSHNNMLALRPILATWLQQAEEYKRKHKLASGSYLDDSVHKFDNGKRKRTSIGPIEKKTLEYSFIRSSHPTTEEINHLSQSLELSKDVIRVWFCNRRQKGKRLKN